MSTGVSAVTHACSGLLTLGRPRSPTATVALPSVVLRANIRRIPTYAALSLAGFDPMILQRVEHFDERSPHFPVFEDRFGAKS
jgi:hypothetical protein